MRFSCTQENLNRGLFVVSHLASRNVNLPILNNVLVRAEEGGVTLITTNLEIGITCTIRGKIEEGGSFTIPGRVFADYINLLPKDKVDVVLSGDMVEVKGGGRTTKMKGEPASEYPIMPTVERKAGYTLSLSVFLKAIQQVAFAASLSESRPEIAGVLFAFQADKKQLTVAATDSYRLAERLVPLQAQHTENRRVIIPVRTLQEVHRIFSGGRGGDDDVSEEVEVFLSDNQVAFVSGSVEVVSRIVAGQYPEYAAIIPSSHRTQAIVHTDELTTAVKSASLFAKAGVNDISLKFIPDSEVVVSALNSQVGENVSSVPAAVTGESVEIALNYRYLLDGISAVGAGEVVVEVTDANTPIVCRPVVPEADSGVDTTYLYLIMPIRQ